MVRLKVEAVAEPEQGRLESVPQVTNLPHTAAELQPKKPARRPAAANNGCPTRP